MGVKGFLLAVILSDSCSVIFLFISAKLKDFIGAEYFNKALGIEMMRFAAPLIPTIVMWAVTSISDRLFIKQMHSDYHELGKGAVSIYVMTKIFAYLEKNPEKEDILLLFEFIFAIIKVSNPLSSNST